MAVCPSCGQENPDTARFCNSCAAPLQSALTVARREERKVVTVLFADLVGFTARAEQLDPEDVRALLAPYHAHLRAELERYGGTVEKFIGDAVMALFGAPATHEDDPVRAVRAALDIRDWAREQDDLRVRIAVNTGEALVALGARASEGEGVATGDVVNTASRLQSAAPVNGVLVGETTYRATSPTIEYREAEPVEAKGKSEPIRVWEALEARARFGTDLPHAHSSLVGREGELDLLRDALDRARRRRGLQLVTLVGVPGIGKSRLVYELFRAVEAEPDFTTWRQGRSLPYGEGASFWALAEIVKAQAGILESDSEGEAAAKLDEAVRRVAADPGETGWMAARMRSLIGLPGADDGGVPQSESFSAWRSFLEALADSAPLVLVFEDLHWADDGLLEFVDQLVEEARSAPILVLCTARPELLERRADWGGGKANALTLSLPPLEDEETATLLSSLLEMPLLEAETQADLLSRAAGNPLYAEQYARMLGERGSTEQLPETVQGIIAARLDLLPETDKALLQDASVVGKVFWLGSLCEIGGVERKAAEEALLGLERRELVQRARRSSVESEAEYSFRHVLVRDVAYSQIPRTGRAQRHRAAAEWVEGLGRLEDHAELLASHYLSALEYTRATGTNDPQLVARARPVLRDAGDRAVAVRAFQSAARFYSEALALSQGDELEPRERARMRSELALLYAGVRIHQGEFADAAEWCKGVVEEAGAAHDRKALADAYYLMHLAYVSNRSPQRSTLRGLALPIYEEIGDLLGQANVLNNLGVDAYYEGRWQEALDLYERSKPLRERIGDAVGAATITNNIGEVKSDQGYLKTAAEHADAARVVFEATGHRNLLAHALSNLGRTAAREGSLDDSRKFLHEARELAEEISAAELIVEVEARLAERAVLGRDTDEALAGAEQLLAAIDQSGGGPQHHAFVHRIRGYALLQKGELGAAEEAFHKSLELAQGADETYELALTLEAVARLRKLRREDASTEARESQALLARLGVVSTPDVPV